MSGTLLCLTAITRPLFFKQPGRQEAQTIHILMLPDGRSWFLHHKVPFSQPAVRKAFIIQEFFLQNRFALSTSSLHDINHIPVLESERRISVQFWVTWCGCKRPSIDGTIGRLKTDTDRRGLPLCMQGIPKKNRRHLRYQSSVIGGVTLRDTFYHWPLMAPL